MSDKHALLEAIKARPREDTPRLAYADWLDEFEDSDQARATAEFIRVACPPRGQGASPTAMPHKAYAWLDGNWWRLVPAFLGRHAPPVGAKDAAKFRRLRLQLLGKSGTHGETAHGVPWRRTGRAVDVKLGLGTPAARGGAPRWYTPALRLTFWKGFAIELGYFSPWAGEILKPLVALDQPLLGTDPY